ncbi:uncharacterized protein LOC144100623 isoform X1 [Amblyomma americanum]
MRYNVILRGVLVATAWAVAAATHDAFPWGESKVLPPICPELIENAMKCDDTVGNSDVFKQNKGKYVPLMGRNSYRKSIRECAETTLSVADVLGVCDDVNKLKNALRCYREATLACSPPEATKVVEKLVTMFEKCVVDGFKTEKTTTATKSSS